VRDRNNAGRAGRSLLSRPRRDEVTTAIDPSTSTFSILLFHTCVHLYSYLPISTDRHSELCLRQTNSVRCSRAAGIRIPGTPATTTIHHDRWPSRPPTTLTLAVLSPARLDTDHRISIRA